MSSRHGHQHKAKGKNPSIALPSKDSVAAPEEAAQKEPEKTLHESRAQLKEQPAMRPKSMRKPDPFDVALWGLLVAAVAGGIYYLQLAAMRGQLDIMSGSERAYISVEAPELRNVDTDLPIAILKVANQGHSPATNVHHRVQGGLCAYPAPPQNSDPLIDDGEVQNDGSLFNGSPSYFPARIHLVAGDRALMKTNNRMCAWGNVTYDTMEKTHHTQFCFVYGGDILPDLAEHCPYHNTSD